MHLFNFIFFNNAEKGKKTNLFFRKIQITSENKMTNKKKAENSNNCVNLFCLFVCLFDKFQIYYLSQLPKYGSYGLFGCNGRRSAIRQRIA